MKSGLQQIDRWLRRFVFSGWAWMIALPPMLVGITQHDVRFHMETMTISSSYETWLRVQDGEERAWLIPSLYGKARVIKPPLTVWANLLVWRGLDRDSPIESFITRSRVLSVGLAVMTILATGWAGRSLGNRRLGSLAMLVTAVMMLFLRQSRIASYDTYLLTFSTLSVAAGFYAAFAARSISSRWGAWMLSGLVLGLGVLTKGPLAYVFVVMPVMIAVLGGKGKRRDGIIGLSGALAVSAVVALPWFMYISHHVSNVDAHLLAEYKAAREKPQSPFYYLGLIGLVFPWSVWMLGGMIDAVRRRRRMFVNPQFRLILFWFLSIFIVMSIPDAKQQRYILPILPSTGLLIAWGWLYASAKNSLRNSCLRIHLILLAVLTLVFAPFYFAQEKLVESGAMHEIIMAQVCGPLMVFAFLGMSVLIATGWKLREFGGRVSVPAITALWMVLATTSGFYGYYQMPVHDYTYRADAERVSRRVGNAPLYYYESGGAWDIVPPDHKFLVYGRRIIRPVERPDISDKINAPQFVMSEDLPEVDHIMEQNGYQREFPFNDGRIARLLWSRTGRDAHPDQDR